LFTPGPAVQGDGIIGTDEPVLLVAGLELLLDVELGEMGE
jgi:hypothetical protein